MFWILGVFYQIDTPHLIKVDQKSETLITDTDVNDLNRLQNSDYLYREGNYEVRRDAEQEAIRGKEQRRLERINKPKAVKAVSKYGAKDWTEILKGEEFTQVQGRKKTRYVIKSITYDRNLDISNNEKEKEIISVNNYVAWFVALNKPADEQYLLLLDVLNFAKKGNETSVGLLQSMMMQLKSSKISLMRKRVNKYLNLV